MPKGTSTIRGQVGGSFLNVDYETRDTRPLGIQPREIEEDRVSYVGLYYSPMTA